MTQKSPAWISGYDCPCTFLTQANLVEKVALRCDRRAHWIPCAVLIGTSVARLKRCIREQNHFLTINTGKTLLLGFSSAELFKKAQWGLLISLRANLKRPFIPRYWQYLGKMLYLFSGLSLVLTARSEERSLHFTVSGAFCQPCFTGNRSRETPTTGLRCACVCSSLNILLYAGIIQRFSSLLFLSLFLSFLSLHKDLLWNFTFSKKLSESTETLYRTGFLQHANDTRESSHGGLSSFSLKEPTNQTNKALVDLTLTVRFTCHLHSHLWVSSTACLFPLILHSYPLSSAFSCHVPMCLFLPPLSCCPLAFCTNSCHKLSQMLDSATGTAWGDCSRY